MKFLGMDIRVVDALPPNAPVTFAGVDESGQMFAWSGDRRFRLSIAGLKFRTEMRNGQQYIIAEYDAKMEPA